MHLSQYCNVIRQLLFLGFQLCFYVWLPMTTFNKGTWWWWRWRQIYRKIVCWCF